MLFQISACPYYLVVEQAGRIIRNTMVHAPKNADTPPRLRYKESPVIVPNRITVNKQ